MEKIRVEKDRFTIINRKFLLPGLTRNYTFPFSSVAEIEAWLPLSQLKEVGDNLYNLERPNAFRKFYSTNTLVVKFKDGHEMTLTPSIYRGAYHKALLHIQELSTIKVSMNDRGQ